MPNHVTHRVVFRGPSEALAAFKAKCFRPQREGEEPSLDFETLIPMPDSIRATESSSDVSSGLIVLGRTLPSRSPFSNTSRTPTEMLAFPWVKEAGVTDLDGLKKLLLERSPDCVAKAEAAIRAFEETGFTDWYDWSIEKWGTKWNAYSFEIMVDEPEELEFRFDTAWGVPEPILDAIAKEFPTINGTVTAFDEGWNFAFIAAIAGGYCVGASQEANDELYERVYGYPPEREDDEEEPTAAETIAAEGASTPTTH